MFPVKQQKGISFVAVFIARAGTTFTMLEHRSTVYHHAPSLLRVSLVVDPQQRFPIALLRTQRQLQHTTVIEETMLQPIP